MPVSRGGSDLGYLPGAEYVALACTWLCVCTPLRCVCVCVCARARVCVCVRARVRVCR